MYTVLLPVDASEERAAAQAATAADLPNATEPVVVNLLRVFENRERAAATDPSDTAAGAVARALLEREDVLIEEVSRAGDPATEIGRAARGLDADLVVLGGRKRSTLGSAVFGSVSQAVMRELDRPVVVTGGREETGVPTHRCSSCGEEYFTDRDVDVATCRNCGGTKVERLAGDESPPVA